MIVALHSISGELIRRLENLEIALDERKRRKATCRLWTGSDRAIYRLDASSLPTLQLKVRRKYGITEEEELTLYCIPDERNVHSRKYVSNEKELDDYFELAGNPTMFVWRRGDPSLSPASLPSNTVTRVSSSDLGSTPSSGTRGHIQKKFRDSVRSRDERKCVLSAVTLREKTGNLEAAHIIGVELSLVNTRESAGVLNEYDTTNGMLLEKSLHVAFDAFKWCMDDTGKVHVRDDAKEDIGKWEGKFLNLQVGEANYPSKQLLRARYELYLSKQARCPSR